MTRAARAYYGAGVGALVSLLIHPVSRPYMIAPLRNLGSSEALASTLWVPSNLDRLPRPASRGDTETFALWILAGTDALRSRRPLTEVQSMRISEVAGLGAIADPNNAFWTQIEAVFAKESRQRQDVLKLWRRASLAGSWNDLQSKRLLRIRQELASETGAAMGWQLRAVYDLRSTTAAQAIAALAKDILDSRGLQTREDLMVRRDTAINARVMRDGGRSVAIGQIGSDLLEEASQPPAKGVLTSHRKRILARQDLVNGLRRYGETQAAKEVDDAFSSNDGWNAFMSASGAGEHLYTLGLVSLLAAVLPGTCLVISLFGALVWGMGALVIRSRRLQRVFEPPVAPTLGVLVAVFVYYLTALPLASLTAVLCFAFLVFTPDQVRSRPPLDLGPVFGFVMFVIGLAVFLNLSAFLIGLSTPGVYLLPTLGIPREYCNGSTLFLGLTGIMLGLLLLTAPSWAMTQRIGTPTVVGIAMRTFGSGLSAVCLGLAVVLGPLAVYADRQASDVLQKLIENEPNYYLVQ